MKYNFSNLISRIKATYNFSDVHKSLLHKYNLQGYTEMSGCLTILTNSDYVVILGEKSLDDMSGWSINDSDGTNIYYESWENISSKQQMELSINNLYKTCLKFFNQELSNNIKQVAIELSDM